MLKIGLTGGIGSGKSTVAKYFTELGIEVIDADRIAHEITTPDTPAFKAIIKKFGTLNRAQLRTLIFQNPAAKKWLENLLHPLIIKAMRNRVKQAKSTYSTLSRATTTRVSLYTLDGVSTKTSNTVTTH